MGCSKDGITERKDSVKREKKTDIELLQPYMVLKTSDYQKIVQNQYGISHFYEFVIKEEHRNQLLAVPDGSVDVLFGIEENTVHTYIGGTVLKAQDWPLYKGVKYFGIRFQPGECILPKDISINDIISEDIEIDGNSFGKDLAQQIGEVENIEERCKIFLQAYRKKIQTENEKSQILALEDYIRHRIYECKGNISVHMLSEETGYSECYIRRIFKQIHGISPKVFEKFVRFQNALNVMYRQSKHIILDEIAVDCGYYDQSHMIKDFKCFAGMTPEIYLTEIAGTKQ